MRGALPRMLHTGHQGSLGVSSQAMSEHRADDQSRMSSPLDKTSLRPGASGIMIATVVAALAIACGGRATLLADTHEAGGSSNGVNCPGGTWEGDFQARHADDLKALAGIREVAGTLSIEGTEIENLRALRCLTRIGKDLDLGGCDFTAGTCEGNPQLTSLDGLQHLESIAGRLMVAGNAALETLESLKALHEVGEGLLILQNPRLHDLLGLGRVERTRWLLIENNDQLTNLQGLDQLAEVACNLRINHNAHIESLHGLEALTRVDGLGVEWNPALKQLTGLAGLGVIGAGLACPGPPPYAWASKGADFSRLESLASLEGLANLSRIEGQLRLVGNPALKSVTGLSKLSEIRGGLDVEACHSLESLDGLSALKLLGKQAHLENCAALEHAHALDSVEWLAPENPAEYSGIVIANNPRLVALPAIELGASLSVFSVVNNDRLDTILAQFTGVQTISISGNDSVTRLAFPTTVVGLVDLRVTHNPVLPNCEATQLGERWKPTRTLEICGNLADRCSNTPCSSKPQP